MDPPGNPHRPTGLRAPSLVEGLVASAVVGLVITAALVTNRDAARPLDVAVLRACEFVERARTLSIERDVPHLVVFDVLRDRIGVVDRDGASVIDPLSRNALLTDLTVLAGGAVDIVSAEFGVAGVAAAFDVQGLPVCAGRVVLSFGDEQVALVLDPETGELRVRR